MPQPPGIIDKVNYTIDFIENPCDAPWTVYVETAAPAALIAAEMLICFDWADIFRLFFRPVGLVPRGARGRGHRRGRRKGGLGFFRRNARRIPGVKALQGRKLSQAGRALWVFDGHTQRLLWWWLMIDVAATFFFNWTTMLNKTEFCQAANSDGRGLTENGGVTISGLVGWNAVLLDIDRYQHGSVALGGGGFSFGPGLWDIIMSAEVKNAASTPITQTMNIRVLGSVQQAFNSPTGDQIQVAHNATGQLVHRFECEGPGTMALQVFVNQSGARVENAIVYIIQRPTEPPEMDKFTCDILRDNLPFDPDDWT